MAYNVKVERDEDEEAGQIRTCLRDTLIALAADIRTSHPSVEFREMVSLFGGLQDYQLVESAKWFLGILIKKVLVSMDTCLYIHYNEEGEGHNYSAYIECLPEITSQVEKRMIELAKNQDLSITVRPVRNPDTYSPTFG